MAKRREMADIAEGAAETSPTRSRPAGGPARGPVRAGLVRVFPRALDAEAEAWAVGGVEIVGRGAGATIRIDDPLVSRRHAEIGRADGGLLIKDLESRDGVSIAGVAAGSDGVLARFGSIVRIGDALLLVVDNVDRYRAPQRTIRGAALGLPGDVVAGAVLSDVWDQATRLAALPHPVLIQGESGTGKESIARIIHAAIGRDRPFVGINVAAIPELLFEAELFGHERGAFTGAVGARTGAFRDADEGVLFLDEVADLRLDLQTKLLRAIDLQVVRPLGSGKDVPVRVRIVAATSQDIQAKSREGQFRSDLLYRLMGVRLNVPPLRQRPDDVVLLTLTALRDEAPTLALSADAAEELALGDWPGNARELRYAVVHAITSALSEGALTLLPAHLPEFPRVGGERGLVSEPEIRRAMSRASGVASKAAGLLGVSRTTFYNSCRRLGIQTSSLRDGEPS